MVGYFNFEITVSFELKKASLRAYRVDNLRPNPLIVKGVVKKAGSGLATPMMTSEQKEWWKKKIEKKTSGGVNGTPLSLHEWKEKYKDCHVTPETDKSLFRKMGKELTKSSLRDKWSENVITLNNAYTKSLTLTKDALDCLKSIPCLYKRRITCHCTFERQFARPERRKI